HVDSTNGCIITGIFTVTATDACTNSATGYVTNTWTLDHTAPSLTVPLGSNLACNATPPTDASVAAQVTATGTCSAVTTNVTHVDSTNGCIITRIFTVTATDACTNSATGYVTNTWTIDHTAPDLAGAVGSSLGCKATPPPDANVAAQVTASDTCSAVTTNVTHVDSTNG